MKQLKRLWTTAESNKRAVNIGLTILVVLLLFFAFTQYTDCIFSTNDDLFMKSILSGEVTGTFEYTSIHMGVLPGLIISSLYRMVPTAPWYGLFLCACQMLAMAAILYQCLRKACKIRTKAVVISLFSLLASGMQLQHFAAIQYTVVAGIVGAVAIFWFFVTEDEEGPKGFLVANIPTFLLFVLSFGIRDKAAFMLLPVAGMLWLAKWLVDGKEHIKEKASNYVAFMVTVIALIALLMCVDRIGYGREDWRIFDNYNTDRESIYDYYGYPDYETHKEVYGELGISYESYVGASTRYALLLDENIDADAMDTLAEVAKQDAESKVAVGEKLGTVVREFIKRNLAYTDRPLNLYVYVAWLVVTLLVFATKQYKVLTVEAALLFGRMVMWGYIFWQGRYPTRVTQALYYTEFVALLAIALRYQLFQKAKKFFVWVAVLLLVFTTVKFGWQKAEACKGENTRRLIDSTAYQQWKEYCTEHSDNFYFVDIAAIQYYTEDIFAKQQHFGLNYVVLGGWIVNSPLYDEKLAEYGIENPETALLTMDNVYVVFVEDENNPPDYLYEYYESKYPGCYFEIVDTYKTDVGDVFQIMKAVYGGAEVE